MSIHVVAGLFLAPDGTMVDISQYRALASACQMAGRPSGRLRGGPCDAWWKTQDKLFEASKSDDGLTDSALAAIFLADGIVLYLDAASLRLIEEGGQNLRISLVMNPAVELGSGAVYQLGDAQWSLGKGLGKLAKGIFIVGAGLTYWTSFEEQGAAGRSGTDQHLQAAIQSLFSLGGGALLGGAGFAAGGPPGAFGGAVAGSLAGDWLYGRLSEWLASQ